MPFKLSQSTFNTATHEGTPWTEAFHKALTRRALEQLQRKRLTSLDGSKGWLLQKVTVGRALTLSVAIPSPIARKVWADNVPANVVAPAGLFRDAPE